MRQLPTPPQEINIDGYLSPFYSDGQPVLITMIDYQPGGPGKERYVAIFDSIDRLKKAMAGIAYDKVVQIQDGVEFIDSIPSHIGIAVNLRKTDEGKIRWTEIFR